MKSEPECRHVTPSRRTPAFSGCLRSAQSAHRRFSSTSMSSDTAGLRAPAPPSRGSTAADLPAKRVRLGNWMPRNRRSRRVSVRAFADVGPGIRGEALAALENLGASHFDALLAGLGDDSNDIAAGSAEAIRRIQAVPGPRLREIVEIAERGESTWPAWTLAHLRRDEVRPYIAALQNRRPDIHYALSVLWTFLESWVSEDWTPRWTA